jgi:hypothetical protein
VGCTARCNVRGSAKRAVEAVAPVDCTHRFNPHDLVQGAAQGKHRAGPTIGNPD